MVGRGCEVRLPGWGSGLAGLAFRGCRATHPPPASGVQPLGLERHTVRKHGATGALGWGLGFLRPLRGGRGVGVVDHGLREAEASLASPMATGLDPRWGSAGPVGPGLARG